MSTFDHDMDNLSWRTVAEADIFLVLAYFYFYIFLCNFLYFLFFVGRRGLAASVCKLNFKMLLFVQFSLTANQTTQQKIQNIKNLNPTLLRPACFMIRSVGQFKRHVDAINFFQYEELRWIAIKQEKLE